MRHGLIMRTKHYWLALLAIPAVWLYALGRSAGELLAVMPGPVAPVQVEPPAVLPGTPPAARLAEPVAEVRAGFVEPSIAEARPASMPSRAAPSSPELAPAVYAEASAEASTEIVEHPEVTDPRMRKLLQPAWDD